MDYTLKRMINEEFYRAINEKKKYQQTREIVEEMVRESLMNKIVNEKKYTKREKKFGTQAQRVVATDTMNATALGKECPRLRNRFKNPGSLRKFMSMLKNKETIPDVKTSIEIIQAGTRRRISNRKNNN